MSNTDPMSLMDPKVQACPWAFYEKLRKEDPVYQMPETGYFIVTRYEDCVEALGKPEIFSSKLGFRVLQDPPEVTRIYNEEGFGLPVDTLITNDPPDHARFRKMVNRAFTAGRVEKLTPYIENEINEIVNQWGSQTEIEVVQNFSVPIPLRIIADQLGVAREDGAKFRWWSDALVEPFGGLIDEKRHIECTKGVVEMQHYFAARIEERRKDPRDDMLGALVQARSEDDGKALTMLELQSIIILLLVAGNETTANALTSAVLLLCQKPELLQQLRENPSLSTSLTEEILRTEAPVQGLFRMTTQDTVLGGKNIPKGATVNIRYGSANRDEARFECPADIKLDRPNPRSHLTFGNGIHTCIGAQLARREIELALKILARRVTNLRLSRNQKELEYYPTLILHGLKSLRVEFDWIA